MAMGATYLITGGTGSFGQKCTELLLSSPDPPKRIVIYSRDELKQSEMQKRFPMGAPGPMRYFIGDVRDKERLRRALEGISMVLHAAALKQVPACEYNPWEAVKTNIIGTQNVVDAAIDAGVSKVMLISTDKACQAGINIYGATKAVAEKLVIQGNAYSGTRRTGLSVTRYGNVANSRGSVIPLWREQAKTGSITLTHPEMTRFWLTLDTGVRFVLDNLQRMQGGEIFVPILPSVRMVDLAKAVASECELKITGIRPGEKIHEVLLSVDESRTAVHHNDCYIICPAHPWWESDITGIQVSNQFQYDSLTNSWYLSIDDIQKALKTASYGVKSAFVV